MPKPGALLGAADVEKKLRAALGHEGVAVKPYGKHYLIQIDYDGEPDTIARITKFDSQVHGAAFKSHTGRWEPLPDEGTRDEMVVIVAEELGPYLDPSNY